MAVHGENLVDRHRQQFGIAASLIFHDQHAQCSATDHRARVHRKRRDDQHIDRIAIVGNGLGNVAIVTGVMHGRGHEAIHKERSGLLVDLVFHGLGVGLDLNDHVEFIGQVLACGHIF